LDRTLRHAARERRLLRGRLILRPDPRGHLLVLSRGSDFESAPSATNGQLREGGSTPDGSSSTFLTIVGQIRVTLRNDGPKPREQVSLLARGAATLMRELLEDPRSISSYLWALARERGSPSRADFVAKEWEKIAAAPENNEHVHALLFARLVTELALPREDPRRPARARSNRSWSPSAR
jgi:hypothetical protein